MNTPNPTMRAKLVVTEVTKFPQSPLRQLSLPEDRSLHGARTPTHDYIKKAWGEAVKADEAKLETTSETVKFRAVCKEDGYDETGMDENNTFAKFSPTADLSINICNPNLFGKLKEGDQFYVDFTKVN